MFSTLLHFWTAYINDEDRRMKPSNVPFFISLVAELHIDIDKVLTKENLCKWKMYCIDVRNKKNHNQIGSYFSLSLQQNSCLNWFLFFFAKLNWSKLNAWWSDRQLVVTHNWNLKQKQIQWRFKFCWNCSITDNIWINFYPSAEIT
jgi:hypothetical protein